MPKKSDSERIRLLLIDDSPEDREIIGLHLQETGRRYHLVEAETGQKGLDAVAKHKPDCVLLDWQLPDMDCLTVLEHLREGEGACSVAVIVLTGLDDAVALPALRQGAQDFVGKAWVTPQILRRAIDHSVERFTLGRDLRDAKKRLELVQEAVDDGVWDWSIENAQVFRNRRWTTMLGYKQEEVSTSSSAWDLFLHPEDKQHAKRAFQNHLDGLTTQYVSEHRLRRRDGGWLWVQDRGRVVSRDKNGKPLRVVGSQTDISERKRAEEALRELNETLEKRVEIRSRELADEREFSRSIIETSQAGISAFDSELRITVWNGAMERLFGVRASEAIGRPGVDVLPPLTISETEQAMRAALRGQTVPQEIAIASPDGKSNGAYECVYAPLRGTAGHVTGVIALLVDVTERRALEAKLRQAQKMEAIGQLAGGIAHDFNNQLQVITGQMELLQRRLPEHPIAAPLIDGALNGARRAAKLTHRLLAFSRQQALDCARVDANKLLGGISELMHRTFGAQIEIDTILASGLWPTLADQNQLENAILNLAVNARDAMPQGGKLTFETSNAYLDENYAAAHSEVEPGQYVMIAVTDSGTGIPADLLDKIFEPFFTTKEAGSGTGLGLSMVYGFVKQSKGHIKVYSELGIGTTVKIYLPRLFQDRRGQVEENLLQPEPFERVEGEVVLIVEDELAIREFVKIALEDLGHTAVEAGDGASALHFIQTDPRIALIFTDIGLPGPLNGKQLVDSARKIRPDLKVLYTTGYTRNAIVHNGILDPQIELLGKPFTIRELFTKIQKVLSAK